MPAQGAVIYAEFRGEVIPRRRAGPRTTPTDMKRASIWIAVVVLALVALGTVSWTSATTVRFTDATGAPASEALSESTTTAT